MKKISKALSCFFLTLLLLIFFVPNLCAEDSPDLRLPAVAGSFYPADKESLSGMIDEYLKKAPEPNASGDDLFLLVVPHAGYIYSGRTAGVAYKLIENQNFESVILLGPSHRMNVTGASVWSKGAWRTPLGDVPIDTELAYAIMKEDPKLWDRPDAHLAEHSLEVQIPFLQKTLKNFKIVPILINDGSFNNRMKVASCIAKATENKKVLIVVSTDMSHYHSDEVARKMDDIAVNLIRKGATDDLWVKSGLEDVELCGMAAVVTALEVARAKFLRGIELLRYTTSGEVTGDLSSVVGYSAWAFYKEPKEIPLTSGFEGSAAESISVLSFNDQKELLKLARQTLESYLSDKKMVNFSNSNPLFIDQRAVFVTLRKKGELRGCIGRLFAEESLQDAVKHMTIESAIQDPRFLPVREEELKDLKIEISVLSPLERIGDVNEIRLGKHGVIVSQGGSSGVFLPKVAIETGWSKEKFLSQLCSQKAELDENCWKDPRTELYVFTSQDFKEDN